MNHPCKRTSNSCNNEICNNHDDNDDDDDSVIDTFPQVDFSGVDFDTPPSGSNDSLLHAEQQTAFGKFSEIAKLTTSGLENLTQLAIWLEEGKYAHALKHSALASRLFCDDCVTNKTEDATLTVNQILRQNVIAIGEESLEVCIELELLGIAALNLFLQSNYTGPSLLDEDKSIELEGIHPHSCFIPYLSSSDNPSSLQNSTTINVSSSSYQNAILSELAVDGHWPCPVSNHPYFLLLARSILGTLADPNRTSWMPGSSSFDGELQDGVQKNEIVPASSAFVEHATQLKALALWSGRAIVAHARLLQTRQPPITLWNEAEFVFQKCMETYGCSSTSPSDDSKINSVPNPEAATIMLEWGLAEHHFDRPQKGKNSFLRARDFSGLEMEVTGAIGKRTKFQTKATAQMLVRAKSTKSSQDDKMNVDDYEAGDESKCDPGPVDDRNAIREQMIEHPEDGILLEKIQFHDEKENKVQELNILDQSILLALCLDVKNNNPADGLTAEEMGAFLARVLMHADDWMVYSTALLERAWLEFERSHARERAILQMQALADQHSNRLTLTQSTRESVEESASVQDRLRNLHSIVYPPRWSMIEDLADRYAALGIVSSAAELYSEIELWDSVVDCYRRAGRVSQAEKIVRERLAIEETPRMWVALGDLTNDPANYQKAIELSRGRYADAFLALGAHYFEKRDLNLAADNYRNALKVRPLNPSAWFRLGTICMQVKQWEEALKAFSEVVMQEPEEGEAWANIAAIHMHNKQPAEAYPALNESLKHQRSNWRVWVSKLYTCLDLGKYDEAIQACNVLLDLRIEKKASSGIPPLEEKCVRAIVGGSLNHLRESKADEAALDAARRTLSRVHALLNRLSSSSEAEYDSWIFETTAFFYQETGQDLDMVLDALMKDYRSLQMNVGWEKDDHLVRRMCRMVSQIVRIYMHQQEIDKGSLTKARFIARGVIQRIQTSQSNDDSCSVEVIQLQGLLGEIETRLQETDS